MPIQINVSMMDQNGSLIQAGSYCTLFINITTRKILEIGLIFYKNKTSYDNIEAPVNPAATQPQKISKVLTDAEYQKFDYKSIHEIAQAYIENFLGNNTTKIVD